MNLIYRLKSGWTTLKFVRVGLGCLILYSAVGSGEVPGIILGGLFLLFSLVTDGVCCAMGGCFAPPVSKNNPAKDKNIEYEELGAE